MKEKLSVTEGMLLQDLEKEIKQHKDSFIKCGVALAKIRDQKLFRKDYATFEEYCQDIWGWSANYGRRLISMSSIAKACPVGTVSTERQARALAPVPEEHRAEVIKLASSSGSATASSIASAAKVVKAKFTPPAAVLDETGIAIPEIPMKYWNRRQEVLDILKTIRELQNHLDRAKKDDDLLYIEVNNSVIADLMMLKEAVSYALPHAVCTCNGRNSSKCTLCKGRGIVSKQLWHKVPREVRDMREKMSKKGKL